LTNVEFVNECGVELIGALASDDLVALAAWVSNDRDSSERLEDRKQVQGLINFLMRERHTSPFEHGIFIYKVDVPIFVAREFHRHRTFSYNEVSGRYTQMKPRFYLPGPDRPLVQEGKMGAYTFVKGTEDQYAFTRRQIEYFTKQNYISYESMLSEGIAKEVARMVLPLNLMTQFYATAKPKNLMDFITLRTHPTALYEIRDVAAKMETHLEHYMPITHKAFRNGAVEQEKKEHPVYTVKIMKPEEPDAIARLVSKTLEENRKLT